jgi:predicted HicB family RNase H-like nuclease
MIKRRTKNFFEMTNAQRDREVAKYDSEMDLSKLPPLSLKDQLLHLMADQKGKRKRIFAFKIDPKLLDRASHLARQRGLTIEQWMEQNVRGAVKSSGR